jgi:hypothetical protein
MIVIDVGAHSAHVQVIRCDFKPGSAERSIHLSHREAFKHEAHLIIN